MAPFLENELEHRDSVYFATKRSGIVTWVYSAEYPWIQKRWSHKRFKRDRNRSAKEITLYRKWSLASKLLKNFLEKKIHFNSRQNSSILLLSTLTSIGEARYKNTDRIFIRKGSKIPSKNRRILRGISSATSDRGLTHYAYHKDYDITRHRFAQPLSASAVGRALLSHITARSALIYSRTRARSSSISNRINPQRRIFLINLYS